MTHSNTDTSKHVVHEDIIDVPLADDITQNRLPLLEALGPSGSRAGMVALLPGSLPCSMGLCLFGLFQLALLTLPANLLCLALYVRV